MSRTPVDPSRAFLPSVLVVEDEPRMREMLMRSVSEMGLPARAAGSAEEAARVLSREPVTILMLDLNLPGTGGLEFLEQVRRDHPHLQAIVITGFGSLEAARVAIHLNVIDFLTKPFTLDDLDAALSRAQERLRALAAQPTETSLAASAAEDAAAGTPSGSTLEEVEREHVLAVLSRNNGNRAAAARELGISERALYYRLSRYQPG